jgi:hypothetical protein
LDEHFRSVNIIVHENDVGDFLRRAQAFVEIERAPVAFSVELSHGVDPAGLLGVAANRSPLGRIRRRFQEDCQVPVAAQFGALQKRAVHDAGPIRCDQVARDA